MPSSLHNELQKFLLHKLSIYSPKREVRFGSIHRSADILVESKKLVIEIQCSSISKQEVMRRNADYQQRGYRPIWILHTKRFGRKIPTQAEIYLREREHYFTTYCQNGGEIFDKAYFPKYTGFSYIHPIKIETIGPFIHTTATRALRQHSQYYCKGDVIDILLSDADLSESMLEKLYKPKRPIKERIKQFLMTRFEKELYKFTINY